MLHLDVYDFKTKPPILGGWRFLSHTHCSWGVKPSNERVHFDPHWTCGITFHMQVPTMISQGPTIHGHILQVSKNGVPMIDQDVKMLFLLNSEKDQSSAWAMRPLPRFLGTSSDSRPSCRTGWLVPLESPSSVPFFMHCLNHHHGKAYYFARNPIRNPCIPLLQVTTRSNMVGSIPSLTVLAFTNNN